MYSLRVSELSPCLQYDNIDEEHKDIFKCIFDCAKDPGSAAFIESLNSVTINHFSEEEVCIVVIVSEVVLFYSRALHCGV